MPTLAALRAHATEIAEQLVQENDGKWETASPRDLERVDALARAVVNRLLHEPTLRLKELRDDRVHARTALVRDLFGLANEERALDGGQEPPEQLAEVRAISERRAALMRIGTRGSALALAQAGSVASRMLKARPASSSRSPPPATGIARSRRQVAMGLGARAGAAGGPDRPRRPLRQGCAGRARRWARAGRDHRRAPTRATRSAAAPVAGRACRRGRASGPAACAATRRSGRCATTWRW